MSGADGDAGGRRRRRAGSRRAARRAYPVATVVVNDTTNNHIPVVSDPCDGSVTPYPNRPPCPAISMGNQAVNRSSTSHGNNGRIVCCRLN